MTQAREITGEHRRSRHKPHVRRRRLPRDRALVGAKEEQLVSDDWPPIVAPNWLLSPSDAFFPSSPRGANASVALKR